METGCARGYLVKELEKEGYFAVGVDISLTALANGTPGAAFVRGDNESLPIRPGSFDGAIAIHTLEHLPSPSAGISEIHRTLRRGGLFLAITPDKGSLMAKVAARKLQYTSLRNPYHVGPMDRRMLTESIIGAGFRRYSVTPFHNGFLGLPQLQKYLGRSFVPINRRVLIPNSHHQLAIAIK